MTDKTPPYVIDFDDIREGDLIELTDNDIPDWAVRGRVASIDDDRELYIPGHGYVLYRTHLATHLLDRPEPPKPALPSAWGTTIRIKGGELDGRLSVLADQTTLLWLTQGDDGGGYLWLSGAGIHDWTVIHDPSAPKADDGLRERMEKLAGELDTRPGILTTYAATATRIREALTDGAGQ